MSVERTETIDFCSIHGETGAVLLTLCDHLPWGDGEHLLLLQEKVNSYLSFVLDGQLAREFPRASLADVRIEIVCEHSPDADAEHFLGHVRDFLDRRGIGFEYRTPAPFRG